MLAVSALGGAEVCAALVPIALFAVDHALGMRLFALIWCNLYFASLLKQALHGPRPSWLSNSVDAWVRAVCPRSPRPRWKPNTTLLS